MDLATLDWTKIESKNVTPRARCFFSFFSLGDNLYLFGGNGKYKDKVDDSEFKSLHKYSTKANTWK